MSNIDIEQYSIFITRKYIDDIFNGVYPQATPFTDRLNMYLQLPDIGDHLISPRGAYFHHGIYVENKKVVHYSGLANGLSSGPVEEIPLQDFSNGKGYKVKKHKCKFTKQEVADRACSRLSEKNYNLIYNNCEHFVNWCIYDVSTSRQVGSVFKTLAHSALRLVGRSTPVTTTTVAVAYTSQYLVSYIKGDISWEKLIDEISHTAITTTSTMYYAGLGQVAIPVPIVGALIGASVGYFIGNSLHQSGLLALGDSEVVKESKERRNKVERVCNILIPEIKKSRKQLEMYLNEHFSTRKAEFLLLFDVLDNSLKKGDSDRFCSALDKINNQFGASLKLKTFSEFNTFMKSRKPLEF